MNDWSRDWKQERPGCAGHPFCYCRACRGLAASYLRATEDPASFLGDLMSGAPILPVREGI